MGMKQKKYINKTSRKHTLQINFIHDNKEKITEIFNSYYQANYLTI